MHEMLTQEPWCAFPDQIANLTDWQIEHLYARPAIERASRVVDSGKLKVESENPELPSLSTAPNPPDPSSPEFKGWVISQFMVMGMSRVDAERQYEEQAKSVVVES
jgi:hypothetical protein